MGNRRATLFIILFIPLVLHTDAYSLENSSELYTTGAKYAMEGRYDDAITVFKKVIGLSPYSCLGHYGLGKAYLYKYGMTDEAIRHLKTSVNLDKGFAKGYFYLGMAYLLDRNYIQSIHSFQKAYRLDFAWTEALYNIGAIFDTIDKSVESKVYYRKYLAEKYGQDEQILFE